MRVYYPAQTKFNGKCERMTINEKHMQLVEAVNNAKTVKYHESSNLYLIAWRMGIRDAGINLSLLDADRFYIDQGIDRPMCCGVWLDWEPTK